jgi:hypothetical protein
MLDSMDRVSPLILITKTGQSFKKRYFARLWDEAMTKAGLQSVMLPGSEQPMRINHDSDLISRFRIVSAITFLPHFRCVWLRRR